MFAIRKTTLSQISHVGISVLPAAAFVPAFVSADAVVVVFDSLPSTLKMVNLLFGFGVADPVLAAAIRRTVVVFVCAVVVLVVSVVAFDSVGSLKICGLLTGFDSIFSGDGDGSTLIRWNVIADVSGNGSVILAGATFCNVVKCTLPSAAAFN